jgi:hypothetical protein
LDLVETLEAKEMSFSFVLIMSSPSTIVVCTPLGQALGMNFIVVWQSSSF